MSEAKRKRTKNPLSERSERRQNSQKWRSIKVPWVNEVKEGITLNNWEGSLPDQSLDTHFPHSVPIAGAYPKWATEWNNEEREFPNETKLLNEDDNAKPHMRPTNEMEWMWCNNEWDGWTTWRSEGAKRNYKDTWMELKPPTLNGIQTWMEWCDRMTWMRKKWDNEESEEDTNETILLNGMEWMECPHVTNELLEVMSVVALKSGRSNSECNESQRC